MKKLLLALILPAAALAQNSGEASAKDKAAFEAVCGACHPSNMANDLRSQDEWNETIDQMKGMGAKATDQQFEAVRRYLAETLTKINVNRATAAEIAPVLGIDKAIAEAVVKRRNEKGNYQGLDDLKKVAGIDAAKLEARKDRIVF